MTSGWVRTRIRTERNTRSSGAPQDSRRCTLGSVATNPAPNTTINVNVLGIQIAQLVFNEQINNPDGSLTGNALHIVLIGGVLGSIGSGDVIVSQATCGPAAPPIPLASGAGMWIGLGLLGLAGIPFAIGVVRRRHTPPSM
jgi:hypothetical protein